MPEVDPEDAPNQPASCWAGDPERVDPDDYSADQPFVKLVTWAPCPACQVQVHTPLTRFLLQGLTCPSCGARLLEAPDDAEVQLAQALRREDDLSSRVA